MDGAGNSGVVWQGFSGSNSAIQGAYRTAGASNFATDDLDVLPSSSLINSTPVVAFDGAGNAVSTGVRADLNAVGTNYDYKLRATGLDVAGPTLTNVSVPGAGTAGSGLGFSVAAFDTWSAVSQFSWNFGDGGSATGSSVGHTYGAPRTYTVTVRP